MNAALRHAPKVFFSCFLIFLLLSNHYDWDHFLAFFEVERRSWLLDFRPPLWTYQLCAGVTRLGDPQSFGLSPLFLPILLFGSLWGAKFLVLGCMGIGYFFLKGTLLLLRGAQDEAARETASALSLLFLFGNYLLWHFHVGHLTFALIPLMLGIPYYALRAYRDEFTRRDAVGTALLTFAFFSAGVYHGLVFFFLPLFFSLGAVRAWLGFQKFSGASALVRPGEWRFLGSLGLGVLLAGYKLLGVLQYQKNFPRSLEGSPLERISPLRYALYQLLPTWNFSFLGSWNFGEYFGIWEYSCFSLISWILIAIGIRHFAFRGGNSGRGPDKTHWKLSAAALLPILLFMLGDLVPWSLHHVLNENLYDHSVRALGRYQFSLQYLLVIFLADVLSRLPRSSGIFRSRVLVAGLLLALVNFGTFFESLSPVRFRNLLAYRPLPLREMREGVLVPKRSDSDSFMYESVLMGKAVANCYEPLARVTAIATEERGLPALGLGADQRTFGLVDSSDEKCRERSYVTQGHVVLDSAACGKGTCVNLNWLRPGEPGLRVARDRRKYCVP